MCDRGDQIDILMATYNGARYVSEQIESLLNQSHGDFQLLVRDDGSTDATPTLLASHAAAHPDRIRILDDAKGRLGSCGSFSHLLEESDANYIMLCDQDDVWLPHKNAMMLQRMKELETRFGRHCPILLHSDLSVVDATLSLLNRSFWSSQRLNPLRGATLNRLLVQNTVTGCASMVNRALLEKAVPVPPGALVHDWWLALVASAFGHIECMSEPTVQYRQHGANQIGARQFTRNMLWQTLHFLGQHGPRERLRKSQTQAGVFLDRYGQELTPAQRDTVQTYANLGKRGCATRRRLLVSYGFYMHGWLRNVGLFAGI